MKLIIGLGNPGKKYQNTRHNLGQIIINEYVSVYCNTPLQKKPNLSSEICETGHGANKVIFAISTEYMNLSGLTVQKIAHYYKIEAKDIYIIHDDLDLPVGECKIQFDRGSAGHNGIKSIIEQLGTQSFHRIRVGIGKPTDSTPVENYVLQPFSSPEKKTISNLIPQIITEIDKIISI